MHTYAPRRWRLGFTSDNDRALAVTIRGASAARPCQSVAANGSGRHDDAHSCVEALCFDLLVLFCLILTAFLFPLDRVGNAESAVTVLFWGVGLKWWQQSVRDSFAASCIVV